MRSYWLIRQCFFVAFTVLGLQNGFTQMPECGFEYMIQQQALYDSTVSNRIQEINRYLERNAGNKPSINSGRNKKIIPVVVHVVWRKQEENISDEQILSQIQILNQDFNNENSNLDKVPEEFSPLVPIDGIRFCLAAQNPQSENSTGIIRVKTDVSQIGLKEALYYSSLGGSDAWNTDEYLNIWVADTGDFLTGFGTYPNQTAAEKQGVVIHPKYFGENNSNNFNLGRVAVHEIGHYLGLNHIWGGNNNCDVDDGVSDTPIQSNSYQGCPIYPQLSCGSSDLFMNFMDYVNDECMLMFTQGQMNRMMNTLEVLRPELLSSEMPCVIKNDNKFAVEFIIYPNPSDGTITIDFPTTVAELADVKIYNIMGQIVFKKKLIVKNSMIVDTTIKAKGIYFFKMGEVVKKMIIR